jgi:hypothetical protein
MIPGGDLEAAFEKYVNDPGRGPVWYKDAEECFIDQFHHNMEYFTFYVTGDAGDVVFGDSNGLYHPLGFFYGKDDGIPKVQQELVEYISRCRQYLLTQILASMHEIQKQRVPVAEIQIPRTWKQLVPFTLFGAKVTINKDAKVLSDSCYGRYVPIEGMEM